MAHELPIRIRYREIDVLGHVNNTNYFVYFEDARVSLFEELGYGVSIEDWKFILASTTCDFLAQARFDQELIIRTEVGRVGDKSFTLLHEIVDKKSGERIAVGKAIIVYFNFQLQQSESIPSSLKEKLEKYESTVKEK
ncbi:thioesterase [Bacillus coahuilensis p1.1.43]|uniref:Thioesterase n=1 Tax=Bacillus coahuilensis p1.1.43 TaxID=1150625 RepID=A0A147KB37_9BACI|nr:thioesterase family protein [Bacillus coahuilensis]KUP08104.1 thioesterase [Bacillus coahuilensis p1.1.43]